MEFEQIKMYTATIILHIYRNFRFGPLAQARRTLLLPSPQLNLSAQPDRGFRGHVFAILRVSPCYVIDRSNTDPTLLPWPQILQPQSEYYPLSTGSAHPWQFVAPEGNRTRRSRQQRNLPDPTHTKSQWRMVRTNKSAYKSSLWHMSYKFNLLEAAFTSSSPHCTRPSSTSVAPAKTHDGHSCTGQPRPDSI
jgi:hypothetical protein